MYIPTSKDAKFKAKGIVDMAGSRFSKASGSVINGFLDVPGNPGAAIVNSMMYGTLMGLGIVGLWALAAIYVGNKYNQLIKNNEIIE
jgi:AAA family ATP:ADP antiporter